jgi:hypothetical protein
MNIHPVSIIFVLFAMGAGLWCDGCVTGHTIHCHIKAFYEAFFIDRFTEDKQLEERIDAILYDPKGARAEAPKELK